MGSSSSKQRLGDRVLEARRKLMADTALQKKRYEQLLSASPETLDVLVRSIGAAFSTHSAFPEAALLVAFAANPEEVQRIMSKCCKKLLSAPIAPAEYEWFMRYVFASSVWLQRGKDGRLMFERLLAITQSMAQKIRQSMDDIHAHLAAHAEWHRVLAIANETVVARQDDERVGLLHQQGIRDVAELDGKRDDDEHGDGDLDELQSFVDSNLALNVVTTAAA